MANWRESGEVPDSEDDDFDSQITDQPSLPPTLQGSVSSKTPIGVKDIWDIPSSQDDDGLAKSDTLTFQHSKQLSVDSSLSTLSPSRAPSDSYYATQPGLDTSNDPPPPLSSSALSEAPVLFQTKDHSEHENQSNYDRIRPKELDLTLNGGSMASGLLESPMMKTEGIKMTKSCWGKQSSNQKLRNQPPNILDEGSVDLDRNTASSSQRSLDPPNDRNESSQRSIHDDTDNTTLDGEELPSLEDLMSGRYKFDTKRSTKRRAYRPSKNHRRDREPHLDPVPDGGGPKFIMPPGSPDPMDVSRIASRPAIGLGGDGLASSPKSTTLSPMGPTSYNLPSSISQDLQMAYHDSAETVDPFESSEQSQLEDGNLLSSASSESESDIVNQNSRKIKGVLPASWLRLDQKSSRNKFQRKITRRPLDPLPFDDNRRGVARRKEASSFSNGNDFLFEESEEEPVKVPNDKGQDRPMHIQTTLEIEIRQPCLYDESIMEHDYIEPLLASRKRQTKTTDAFNSQPKRQKWIAPKASKATAHSKQNPPLHARSLGEGGRKPNARRQQKNPRVVKHAKSTRKTSPVPRLSILDVIEPNAPRFIRIAARTVKGRRDRGRSSPNGKNIQLATRKDHIDAISALRDWTSGSIKQRTSVSVAHRTKAMPRNHVPLDGALSQFSARLSKGSIAKQKSNQLTKTKRTASISFSKLRDNTRKSSKNSVQMQHFPTSLYHHTRLAQLEVDDDSEAAGFSARSLYQGDPRGSEPSSVLSSAKQIPSFSPNRNLTSKTQQPSMAKNKRCRKHTKPRRIDIEAPEYSHANDPLPPVLDQTLRVPADHQARKGAKLFGLGPYGTHLIGTGAIEIAASTEYPQSLWLRKQQVPFTLDGERFQWESGLLRFHLSLGYCWITFTPDGSDAIAGSAFLLSYVNTALSFTTDSDLNSFLSRILEVIQNFKARIISIMESKISLGDSSLQPIAQVLDYILVILYLCVRISRTDPSLLREQFSVENLLKSSASIAIRVLLQFGPHRLRQALSELDHFPRRACGLGFHDLVIHSWVVTMKVLEVARVPPGFIWAIFQRTVLPPTFY
ncbi:unnamed protein product [Clonostachys solani]|uniref:Uncharacterized protein n=1 Tax=Clonostachys solani TaxID=160281 RepID=A0A9N9W353_9HYPO|nr:unnamed protein product [Clonostachys solani]